MQKFWGHMNFIWFGPLFVLLLGGVGRYRCRAKADARLRLKQLLAEHPDRSVLLCANHLTMIDSMLITAFLFDLKTLLLRFRYFPWNVPELKNFGSSFLLRAMCYLGKCVYVERKGSAESRKLSWEKILHLNRVGEAICIFPEGGRSRTGRIDRESAVYGVGQLVQASPETLVIAVYLRGAQQHSYSFFPRRREDFFLDWRRVPCAISDGKRGQKNITMQIIGELEAMEQNYLEARQ
jgi:1-acyl-sn-glycerol-3-phosphate acyltransferase